MSPTFNPGATSSAAATAAPLKAPSDTSSAPAKRAALHTFFHIGPTSLRSPACYRSTRTHRRFRHMGTMPEAESINQLYSRSERALAPIARLDKQSFGAIDALMISPEDAVAPLQRRQVMEFPYKHSTGDVIGRFLAGLKVQKKIWGQRVAGLGVVVPPLGYSEADGSAGGEWVEVAATGVVTAVAVVREPIERLHPFTTPFAFVLVRLDGADTAMA